MLVHADPAETTLDIRRFERHLLKTYGCQRLDDARADQMVNLHQVLNRLDIDPTKLVTLLRKGTIPMPENRQGHAVWRRGEIAEAARRVARD